MAYFGRVKKNMISTGLKAFLPVVGKPAGESGWWLSGDVPAANCVAAWQAKGTASKAASLVDLTGGGYDLSEEGTVTFNAASGWTGFSGQISNDVVSSAVGFTFPNLVNAGELSANGEVSIIIRCTTSTVGSTTLVALSNSETFYTCYTLTPEVAVRILSGNVVFGGGAASDKVYAITAPSGQTTNDILCYINGSAEAIDSVSDKTPNRDSATKGVIGMKAAGSVAGAYDGIIAAVAIYNIQLTEAQVQAITTAMQAL